MKRVFSAVLISIVIINAPSPHMFSISKAEVTSKVASKAQVGIFYYAWYGAIKTDWQAPKFVDHPISDMGNYNSLDKTVIEKQLVLIEDLGIDFVVISWWGLNDAYGEFIDQASKDVFEIAHKIKSTLKFAIMIEPFNRTGNYYDYKGIYNYVYETFAEPYSELYYNFNRKPLLCFFNNEDLTPNGDFIKDEKARFIIITVGQQPYTEWFYTNINYCDPPLHKPRGQISVTPRYDDSQNKTKTEACIVDQDLTAQIYDEQWKNATQLAREGKIDFIMISSWNEYVERTQIEPHIDGISNKPPDYLYNKTRDYIKQLNCEKNVQIHAEDYNAFTLNHLSDLGVTWVRMDYEIGITESMITALHNNGYKVLSIIGARTSLSKIPTLEEWNNTLKNIVSTSVSQLIDGWEIWNEPNSLGSEGAFVAPLNYQEMLKCASETLRNSTKAIIISGGLAPHENYSTYLNATFNNPDIKSYYEYFGLHLYEEPLTSKLKLIQEAKTITGKDVWITEMGQPSETGDYNEANQASYLVDNIVGITNEVERIFIYELYDGSYSQDEQEKCFGLLNATYEKKLAYYALKELRLIEETEEKTVEPWYQNPIILVIIVASCVLALLLARKICHRQQKKSLITPVKNTVS